MRTARLIGGYGWRICCSGSTRSSIDLVWQTLVFRDVFTGLIKPVLFGFIISTVGCYYGMSTRGGTRESDDPRPRPWSLPRC